MKIEIVDYNPQWEADFLNERQIISTALAELQPYIEHIGSTSVKGLGAKPIIDIMVGLKDESEFELLPERMIKIGFTYYRVYNEDMPERRLFAKLKHPDNIFPPQVFDKGEPNPYMRGFSSKVNCHCVVFDGEFWRRHIAFRNYLRAHDSERDAYYKLKKELSEQDWQDRNDYTDAKSYFILRVQAEALSRGYYRGNQ